MVLSVDEVQKVFAAIQPQYSLMIRLLYGSGMRMGELLNLRVQDIDFDHGLITIHGAKGDKDRTTLLPESLVKPLRQHLQKVKKAARAGSSGRLWRGLAAGCAGTEISQCRKRVALAVRLSFRPVVAGP